MVQKPKAGDFVTATVNLSDRNDHPRHRPYTVIGVAYELPEHPDCLWVGSDLIVTDGAVLDWVSVTVLRAQVSA